MTNHDLLYIMVHGMVAPYHTIVVYHTYIPTYLPTIVCQNDEIRYRKR